MQKTAVPPPGLQWLVPPTAHSTILTTVQFTAAVLHQNSGGIGKSSPDAREIYRGRNPRQICLQGVGQKILPCRQGRIGSVKINPFLLVMRECSIESIDQCTLDNSDGTVHCTAVPYVSIQQCNEFKSERNNSVQHLQHEK